MSQRLTNVKGMRAGGSRLPLRLGGERFRIDLGNRGQTVSRPPDLLQGTLDLLLLKVLAVEPLHGWAISQRM
jgi:hypothetical protein